ncbi:MAG: ImmA/IrrE family metallo-endopeptidase [Streptococcaceae bacterium]|jgi:Zn-dependent peptidase ImmA (M78 family)|nr:ImmA/IrrE family metallo-endopeptidase [Streptococcaceae bacterium]
MGKKMTENSKRLSDFELVYLNNSADEFRENHPLPGTINKYFDQLGIELKFTNTRGNDGESRIVNGKPLVIVNIEQKMKEDNDAEMVFSALHELAHLILDFGWQDNKSIIREEDSGIFFENNQTVFARSQDRNDLTISPVELRANEWAAAIMMPRNEVASIIKAEREKGNQGNSYIIDKIKTKLEVPENFAKNRYESVRRILEMEEAGI